MAEVLEPAANPVGWSGTRVDAERIETELGRLRYEAAGRPAQGESYAMRSSFTNLVVYANDAETGRHASQLVAALSGQHPSRTIIIVANPIAPESGIETALAAHCHVSPGLEQKVCCEEVTLSVDGPAANHLHSVVAPLLIPELPNYVWWIGGLPHDHHLFDDVIASADRLIVDSARFTKTASDLPQLQHVSTTAGNYALGDLNWQRLLPWRQIVLQECSTPSLERYIGSLTSIKLSFASDESEERWSQPLLIAGWLSALLAVDASSPEIRSRGAAKLRHGEREVMLRIVPTEFPQTTSGNLVSIELRCSNGDNNASLTISRKADPLHLEIIVHEPNGTIQSHVRIDSGDEGMMLDRELNSLTHDPEYAEALQMTVPLVSVAQ